MIDRSALKPLVDSSGRFAVLALDHRDSLRVEFDAADPQSVPVEALVSFKRDVVRAFGTLPSAVMLDPEFSIDQILLTGLLPSGVGSLCALEAQGYLGVPDVTTNHLLEGWSAQRAKDVGASAAKLLVLYRPDRGPISRVQEDLIRSTVDACGQANLPLFVEPVPYDVIDVDDRERTVLGSVERIAALGPDVIKMPFPSDSDSPERWERACQAVNDALDVPWAVLSWGAPFEVFVRQVAVACEFGCSGFMAGRAIWAEAVHTDDRQRTLAQIALPRFAALVDAIGPARSALSIDEP